MSREARLLDRLLDPVGRCLNAKAARALVGLRADPKVQARMQELADKNTEGDLTPRERDEYEAYVRAGSFIAILQAKAKSVLRTRRSS